MELDIWGNYNFIYNKEYIKRNIGTALNVKGTSQAACNDRDQWKETGWSSP